MCRSGKWRIGRPESLGFQFASLACLTFSPMAAAVGPPDMVNSCNRWRWFLAVFLHEAVQLRLVNLCGDKAAIAAGYSGRFKMNAAG
jgi:hypothetical protein